MQIKLSPCLLFVVFIYNPLSGQSPLTLEEAIKIGLENNYSVKIANNDASIEQNNFSRGNAGFFPEISLNASKSFTNQDVKQEFIDNRINERDGATSDVLSTGVNLNWTVFNGLRMFATYEKLNEMRLSGGLELESVVEATIRDISLAYYRIILELNKLSVLDTSLQLSSERLELAKSKYEVGKASKLEYMSAQVDYNADKSALIKQKELLENAKIDLNQIMSRDLEDQFNVYDRIDIDTTLLLSELEQDALVNNKDIMMVLKDLAISNLELREINTEKLPSVGLNLGYNYNNLNSQSGFLLSNRTNGWTYGVSAIWPIFNGFSVQRRAQNARIEISSDHHRVDLLKLQISADLKKTYINYKNNIQLLVLERENFQVARENSEIALERYRLGRSNALELREAQINAVESAGRLIDASYNTKIAEIQLLWLSGHLVKKN